MRTFKEVKHTYDIVVETPCYRKQLGKRGALGYSNAMKEAEKRLNKFLETRIRQPDTIRPTSAGYSCWLDGASEPFIEVYIQERVSL